MRHPSGVLFELTLCRKRAVTLKLKSMKTFIEQPKNRLALCLRRLFYQERGNYNETRTIAGGLHSKAGDLSHRTGSRSQRMCHERFRFKLRIEKQYRCGARALRRIGAK